LDFHGVFLHFVLHPDLERGAKCQRIVCQLTIKKKKKMGWDEEMTRTISMRGWADMKKMLTKTTASLEICFECESTLN
jgi:hypothetical protein